jgi:hypothetical protein
VTGVAPVGAAPPLGVFNQRSTSRAIAVSWLKALNILRVGDILCRPANAANVEMSKLKRLARIGRRRTAFARLFGDDTIPAI